MPSSFSKPAQPVSKEDFRSEVERWEREGHRRNVVTVDFDGDTGEFILVVVDYVDFERSYFVRATPWQYDAMEEL